MHYFPGSREHRPPPLGASIIFTILVTKEIVKAHEIEPICEFVLIILTVQSL